MEQTDLYVPVCVNCSVYTVSSNKDERFLDISLGLLFLERNFTDAGNGVFSLLKQTQTRIPSSTLLFQQEDSFSLGHSLLSASFPRNIVLLELTSQLNGDFSFKIIG